MNGSYNIYDNSWTIHGNSCLLHHDLAASVDVEALAGGLALELAPVHRVPSGGSPLPCRGGAGGGVGNLHDSRLLAGVAKVEGNGAGGVRVAGVATGQAIAEGEVGAEGAEPVAVGAGPVELVGGALAQHCGFTDRTVLQRTFKKIEGITPQKYLENLVNQGTVL